VLAPGLLDRHAAQLAAIREACPWDPAAFVSSHNDPNPRNMLFDGARVWLVDWELAFRHDPLFDLAILSLEFAATPEAEDALLAAAFGRAPDGVLRAKLALTRLLARLFYGCIALEAVAGKPRAGPESSLDALTPEAFGQAMAERRIAPPDVPEAFGKMSLAAFMAGCSSPDFARSLAVAARG
jgi:hypothetical protein